MQKTPTHKDRRINNVSSELTRGCSVIKGGAIKTEAMGCCRLYWEARDVSRLSVPEPQEEGTRRHAFSEKKPFLPNPLGG